ncbi:solute carrier family 13 member 5 [Ixodes scapularis]|uniref:solute carrier family 13 member 5 n=1 Tax=Ixodes scapularis TaxID=6945 RepID=UPI001A9D8ECF|nr:solute carrier family 13 member 5 [Ixodes scapularis]
MVSTPILLLPLLFVSDSVKFRCAYVVAVIAVYWIVEPIPIGATSLIPVVLLPMLGVLSTEKTCLLYMNEMIVTFLGTLIMAIAIEESCLHQRIALGALCLLGTGVKMLVFGLMAISMFLSMWINNIAITAMMMPVVDSLSQELLSYCKDDHDEERDTELDSLTGVTPEDPEKGNGCANGLVYLNGYAGEKTALGPGKKTARADQKSPSDDLKKRIRVLLYLSVTYGANTGAITTITSAGSNICFQFVINDEYEGRAPVDYATWLFFALPITLVGTVLIFLLVVPVFFRCRRPEIDEDGGVSAMNVIRRNYASLGPIRFHEVAVLLLFTLLVFLWLFRDPMFARGWATFFSITKPKDATAVMIAVVLLFIIPAEPKNLTSSPGLVTWKAVQAKLQWSVILLIGSGFAIAEAMRVSGLSHLIGQHLGRLAHLSPGLLMAALSIFCSFMTELISNAGTVTVLLPVFAAMAEELKINPLLFMIPATITSNFAFLLPVGTPANAIVYEHARLKLSDMVLPGFLAKVITVMTTVAVTYVLGDPVFGMFQYPDWIYEARVANGTHV